MTQKHYKAVAEIIKKHQFEDHFGVNVIDVEKLVTSLMDVFEENNERFDREKFLGACGL